MQSRHRHRSYILVVLVLICAFAAGMYDLLSTRFDTGDVYPVYSSLRPDPLGTMALFESIDSIEGMRAVRNLKPLQMMPEPDSSTVFYLGLSTGHLNRMGKGRARMLHAMAMDGARVVIALSPARARRNKGFDRLVRAVNDKSASKEKTGKDARESEGKEEKTAQEERPQEENKCGSETQMRVFPFYEIFRLQLGIMNAGEVGTVDDSAPVALSTNGGEDIPSSLKWHSAAYIDKASPAWETVYALGGRPVAMQRYIGKGSVVVITDSYHITNEALMSSREPGLLAWLIGTNTKVIFEESHLGLSDNPGVASLGRKYGLQWFALALVVLALLFVWQNASSLVPHERGIQEDEKIMSGKDYASGMVSLMRRSVPSSRLVRTCFDEWKKTFLRKKGFREDTVARAEKLLDESVRVHPVQLYAKIDKILNERNR